MQLILNVSWESYGYKYIKLTLLNFEQNSALNKYCSKSVVSNHFNAAKEIRKNETMPIDPYIVF